MSFTPAFVAFIRENIISVEQIHVLLLLSKDASRRWRVQEISEALTSTPRSVLNRLRVLQRRGLVDRDGDGRFGYAPTPSTDALVAELERQYAVRPVSVISLIFSKRNDALESFSEAFRLGAEDHDR
jgi:predicted DNA-binding transcriptional regulator